MDFRKLMNEIKNERFLISFYDCEIMKVIKLFLDEYIIFEINSNKLPFCYEIEKTEIKENRIPVWFEENYISFVTDNFSNKKNSDEIVVGLKDLFYMKNYKKYVEMLQNYPSSFHIKEKMLVELQLKARDDNCFLNELFTNDEIIEYKKNIKTCLRLYCEILVFNFDCLSKNRQTFLIKIISNPYEEDVELYEVFKFNPNMKFRLFFKDYNELLISYLKYNKNVNSILYNKAIEIFPEYAI